MKRDAGQKSILEVPIVILFECRVMTHTLNFLWPAFAHDGSKPNVEAAIDRAGIASDRHWTDEPIRPLCELRCRVVAWRC